jgi:arylsulfatase A-like enzyme
MQLPERLRQLYSGLESRPVPNLRAEPPWQQPLKDTDTPRGLASHAVHLDYMRHVTGIDENISRLLAALDTMGLAQDTVLVYTSDNGYYLGEHCSGDKRSLYDESLRIPFLVRYPRLFPKGRVNDDMILNIDLAPTFLDLAGVTVPKEMHGVSWTGLAMGRQVANWRRSFFAQYYKELGDVPTCHAIRTTTHKLVKYPGRPQWSELFDLIADPYECNNLASDTTLYQKLDAELDALIRTVGYKIPAEASAPGQAKTAAKDK